MASAHRVSPTLKASTAIGTPASVARKLAAPSTIAGCATRVVDIATVNLWNRLNVATRQVVGEQSW